ncbi:fused MFS/spermidine synthase [Desulfurivibrio alkaliphilus]|uniref:Polyamine aminopropyltransferase n=1 Tax=Desulfurivibrio alkaliphilus (strain DSM 19089 / UNIQEM U267 / AHT2) TaxID=589865 RepID=D6Z578_DESAT|nr:fused MFS/spermidine synthase [Desulfurivibrio alkaliphilus]ADH84735.1 Spermine synthase [Desulfurivibrio alkaliphilus AHT 2]
MAFMKRRVCVAILVMGFSGLVAEILLLRELLIVFSGNELSIGIILANWLLLEAFGCYFVGRRTERSRRRLMDFTFLTVLFSLALVLAVFLTRLIKPLLGVSIGESIGVMPMFYSSLLILLPVSILHGALFTYSCQIYADLSARNASPAGRVYVYETVGTIIGGIACTYLLIPHLHALQAVVWLALLNFAVCLVLLAPLRQAGAGPKAVLAAVGGLLVLGGYAALSGQVERWHHHAIKVQWQGLNVVHYQHSPYGNISVVENEGQYIYFLDGVAAIFAPIPDIPMVEKFVNIPLLVHPEPREVLVLSGGAGGVINEILKHPTVDSVEYAEQDPLLLELLERFPTPLTVSELTDPKVRVHPIDGRLWLKTSRERYDLIFIGVAEPANLQANRYFTAEFFALVQSRLKPDGIVVLGLPGSLTFLNDELKNLNSSIFHTLESVFAHLRVIPGDGRNLFMASDAPAITTLDAPKLLARLEAREISTEGMMPWHIERQLHPGWQEWFADFIADSSRKINYDFQPLAMFYQLTHWNALYSPAFGRLFQQFERVNLGSGALLLLGLPVACLLARRLAVRPLRLGIPLAIAGTGFAGMIYSLVVIFAFQTIYGYVFSWIGLLVAAFMAGAAAGAMLTSAALGGGVKTAPLKLFKQLELVIIGFSLLLPLLFVAINAYALSESALLFARLLFLLVSLAGGLLVGAQFPLANQLYLGSQTGLSHTAALLYTSDLLGGWVGGIIGGVVLLPVLGLTGTCMAIGMLKVVSFVIISSEPAGLYKEV